MMRNYGLNSPNWTHLKEEVRNTYKEIKDDNRKEKKKIGRKKENKKKMKKNKKIKNKIKIKINK